ncbi:protein of unknown function [Xenorhabdus doucetiae]|uniref:Uncharacterized protein n=1 Tax=Xenorhabdus doucetiae TaxID=351671 RepID=A0A068QWA9_9GAMM|nr:protein of unknown function [Xenorhabdus doucetiae]
MLRKFKLDKFCTNKTAFNETGSKHRKKRTRWQNNKNNNLRLSVV